MASDLPIVGMAVEPAEAAEWRAALMPALAGLPVRFIPDASPGDVRYLVYNVDSGITEFGAYPKLRAILNTWAGVEAVVGRVDWPESVDFCRMVEPGLTEGMVDYLVGHTMRYHIDIDRFIADSAAGQWQKWSPPLARDRRVAVLGLGALGARVAGALAGLGFDVHGWSRRAHMIDGVTCHHGSRGLETVLGRAKILCLILPLTPDTRNLLDSARLARLPRGACLINAGRGALIDDAALLAALETGHVRHATLDVFREEPLPGHHPYWRHPRVTVTPHIAAITRVPTAAVAIAEQIARDLDGDALHHIVDRARGY